MANRIEHIFVLMLENRSFDHMLGFSGITGTDAVTGSRTSINGLTGLTLLQLARSWGVNSASGVVQKRGGKWPPPPTISIRALLISSLANTFNGQAFPCTESADYAMPADPGHEFENVMEQLCGTPPSGTGVYPVYPSITSAGFVASYVATGGQVAQDDPGEIMKCYSPSQLPVLNFLAQEFAVCDNWYSSMPGPTIPNRFFAHAGSSGGLDHSPSPEETLKEQTTPGEGYRFQNGTIFDRLNSSKIKWRIYAGDDLPLVAALKGIDLFDDRHDYHNFSEDVAQTDYLASYTFIEPSYGQLFSEFKCGTSQHPQDDVTRGEMLIKCTYDAIRNSPLWNSSMLIITWDEHGGFFDHVRPPPAIAPGDSPVADEDVNQWGFTFQQYGVRVPAVVVSPLIPRNLIDHRLYDHASIPATLEACFGLAPMTQRDANAHNLMALVSLPNPRGDARPAAPSPKESGVGGCDPFSCSEPPSMAPIPPSRPQDTINEGNLPGLMHIALKWDLTLSPSEQRDAIIARFRAIRTRGDGWQYMNEVRQKVAAAKAIRPSTPR